MYKGQPLVGDLSPPTVPEGLAATVVSRSEIDLSWTPSIDLESGVTEYRVIRNGFEIGTTTTNSFNDSQVPGIGTYLYQVSAVNGDGFDDLIIGQASFNTIASVGKSYVVFGRGPTDAVVRFGADIAQRISQRAVKNNLPGGH